MGLFNKSKELKRNEIANKYYGKHSEINTENKDDVLNYLNELDSFLNNYEYESNSDFIFCGRKKFVYEEIIEIMDGTKSVDDPVYFILGSLKEFLCTCNGGIPLADGDASGMNLKDLRDANDRYISTGVICLEEIQYVRRIISLIKNYLEDLTDKKENVSSNEKIDSVVDLLSKKIKEIDTDSEITVLKLLGPQPERFNEIQLTKIATTFFEKNKDLIEFMYNPNEKIGLIYNLPFKKKGTINLDKLDSN